MRLPQFTADAALSVTHPSYRTDRPRKGSGEGAALQRRCPSEGMCLHFCARCDWSNDAYSCYQCSRCDGCPGGLGEPS